MLALGYNRLENRTKGKFMTTSELLQKTVYGYWASRFDCDIDFFSQKGIYIFANNKLSDKKKLVTYQIGKLTVVWILTELAKELDCKLGFQAYNEPVSSKILSSILGINRDFELKSTLLDHFLASPDFIPQPIPEKFALKRLDPKDDKELLSKLFNACTAEELDDADIILDEPDPVIIGLIYKGELAAYASHRYCGDEEIADIGVLIHPNYRGQGLGKAIVSSLCAWCIKHNVTPMYRVFDDNAISKKIPTKLGFGELVTISTYDIKKK